MKKQFKIKYFFLFVGFIVLTSCIKRPDFPDEPVIEFISMNRNQMIQDNFNTDSLRITFSFTDGDGDLGNNDSLNIFIRDNRDQFIASQYRLPMLPSEGASRGIEGEITITIYTTCCIFPDGTPPCTPSQLYPRDTLTYDIFIKDRAGHESNTITTNPIVLLCQ
ncbi:hypothetical protein [Membranihabitans maritimus]|uniref:hypothetical protein n=1 Tax=Membranihabitans maritimus TaxID=2904244 RepID=UPI001F273764|nr:hypothetical protein [Membranihabitans maritimus]